MTFAGELAALGTAVCWAAGSNFFAAAGRRMGPMVLNRLRITTAAMFLVIGACLVTGTAQQPTSGKLEDPPWIKELAAKRIVYSISSMNRVKVRKDLTYKRVDGAELKNGCLLPCALAARRVPRRARR